VSQISPGRVLQAKNMYKNIKEPFLPPSLPLNPSSTSSSTTTGDRHEPPLLAVGPPHGEEQFN